MINWKKHGSKINFFSTVDLLVSRVWCPLVGVGTLGRFTKRPPGYSRWRIRTTWIPDPAHFRWSKHIKHRRGTSSCLIYSVVGSHSNAARCISVPVVERSTHYSRIPSTCHCVMTPHAGGRLLLLRRTFGNVWLLTANRWMKSCPCMGWTGAAAFPYGLLILGHDRLIKARPFPMVCNTCQYYKWNIQSEYGWNF